jgi:hypothetical protein
MLGGSRLAWARSPTHAHPAGALVVTPLTRAAQGTVVLLVALGCSHQRLERVIVMQNPREDEVIERLRERAARGALDGIDVSYRITGGAPGERLVDEEVRLSGPGPVHARLGTSAGESEESSEKLSAPEMNALLLDISEGLSELVPRSEARFVPDSIVGQISVSVDGQEASFFFLPDPEQAKQQGKVPAAKAARIISALDRLHKRILKR